ncbi:MAG: glucuronate isomerase [Planctomycetota bacterium]
MSPFSNPDWLLTTPLSRTLYHAHAAGSPLIDYHSHVDPGSLANNAPFNDLGEMWVRHDPYKHRAMRLLGVPESRITGGGGSRLLFKDWAAVSPSLAGNPLHDWSRLELQRVFGIDTPLCPATADSIWAETQERLEEPALSPRGRLRACGVETVCSSDGPLDDLTHHRLYAESAGADDAVLRPSLRGDLLTGLGEPDAHATCDRLAELTGVSTNDFDGFCAAVAHRLDLFHNHGCRIADHAIDRCDATLTPVGEAKAGGLYDRWRSGAHIDDATCRALQSSVLVWLAGQYRRRGWSLLLHIGAQRQTSSRLCKLAGPAGGYAALGPPTDTAALAGLLDAMEQRDALPRTVLFNLNPADNAAFATLTGSFARDGEPGYVSWGPTWWFNDHALGIDAHLDTTAAFSLLAVFPGMTTDARSLLSMHRHEYFRRLLCDWIGREAEAGRMPSDEATLGPLLRRMLYDNPARLLSGSSESTLTPTQEDTRVASL